MKPSVLEAFADRIGVLPDGEVARLAGVTPDAVRAYRRHRKIAVAPRRGPTHCAGPDCHEPIQQPTIGARRKYCSNRCSQRKQRWKKPGGRAVAEAGYHRDGAELARAAAAGIVWRLLAGGNHDRASLLAGLRSHATSVHWSGPGKRLTLALDDLVSSGRAEVTATGWRPVFPATVTGKRRSPFAGFPSKIEPFADKVGVLSDAEVADLAGVSRNAVLSYRQLRFIPPAPPTARRHEPSAIAPFKHLLGVQSDGQVAALAGVGRSRVKTYRERFGIPPADADPTPRKGSKPKLRSWSVVPALGGVFSLRCPACRAGVEGHLPYYMVRRIADARCGACGAVPGGAARRSGVPSGTESMSPDFTSPLEAS